MNAESQLLKQIYDDGKFLARRIFERRGVAEKLIDFLNESRPALQTLHIDMVYFHIVTISSHPAIVVLFPNEQGYVANVLDLNNPGVKRTVGQRYDAIVERAKEPGRRTDGTVAEQHVINKRIQ